MPASACFWCAADISRRPSRPQPAGKARHRAPPDRINLFMLSLAVQDQVRPASSNGCCGASILHHFSPKVVALHQTGPATSAYKVLPNGAGIVRRESVQWEPQRNQPIDPPNRQTRRRLTMKASRLIAALMTIASGAAFAQSAGEEFVQRNINQQQRIEQGLQSGQLNTGSRPPGKGRSPRRNMGTRPARWPGHPATKHAISTRRRTGSAATSTARSTMPRSATRIRPSSQRMQADVQRNVNQQQRIQQGLNNGSLTSAKLAASNADRRTPTAWKLAQGVMATSGALSSSACNGPSIARARASTTRNTTGRRTRPRRGRTIGEPLRPEPARQPGPAHGQQGAPYARRPPLSGKRRISDAGPWYLGGGIAPAMALKQNRPTQGAGSSH